MNEDEFYEYIHNLIERDLKETKKRRHVKRHQSKAQIKALMHAISKNKRMSSKAKHKALKSLRGKL
ncbi:MAG: hypothetical protein QXV17_10740 [Candidatus Micrarchaeaceae archaeon]